MDESLISDDSEEELDFDAHSDSVSNVDEEDIPKFRAKRTRRNFKLTIELMREAIHEGGSKDDNGIYVATSAEIAIYIANKLSIEADRSLRNAVYHKLRTGKEYEKREEKLTGNQKREHKAYFYIKDDVDSNETSTSRLTPPMTPVSNSSTSLSVSTHNTTNNGGGGGGVGGLTSSSSFNNISQIKKEITNDVPNFGGFNGHKKYFHKEALDRGLNRANKIISRLAETTGLKEVLGELNVEVLDNNNCDKKRWETLLHWHEKYDRMKKVFAGIKDDLVDGYRFVLVLNCYKKIKNKKTNKFHEICEPISVGSITPHRVYNKPTNQQQNNNTPLNNDYSGSYSSSRRRRDSHTSVTSSSPNYNMDTETSNVKEHWHVEIELQTLLVPVAHQGKGIGTVMQRAMYVLAQSLASEPDPPYYDDDEEYDDALKNKTPSSSSFLSPPPSSSSLLNSCLWQSTSSTYIGRRIVRIFIDENDERRMIRGVVESWLPANESNFLNEHGEPASLWRVRYTTPGMLEGELEDLEEYELLNSLPPCIDTTENHETSSTTTSSSGQGQLLKRESGGGPIQPQPYHDHPYSLSSKNSLNICPKAEMLDAEEACNISIQRITCVTTVYLDDMAKKFYLKNDMKEMLPPYDDGSRRSGGGGGSSSKHTVKCASRARIWDNCDHKRLHWWYNTIYGSSFNDDISPEQSLELAIANTVKSCKEQGY